MRKQQLLTTLSIGLQNRGLAPVPGSCPGAASVHFKRLNGLVLLFGVELSRHYEDRYTGAFYLSKSFHWGYVLPGFPSEAYRRIGHFLFVEERKKFLEEEFQLPGVVDAWWIGFSQRTCDLFLEAFDLAIPRFLSQPRLFERVSVCPEVQNHIGMINQVSALVPSLSKEPSDCTHQPTKRIKAIGLEWYWAAEIVLRNVEPELISEKYVELLAVDAWRNDKL